MHLKTPASVFLRSTLRKQETHAHGLQLSEKFPREGDRRAREKKAPSSSLDVIISFISYSDVVCSMNIIQNGILQMLPLDTFCAPSLRTQLLVYCAWP